MGDVVELGYTDGGDTPKWAAAKASARDVLEGAFRQYNPFEAPHQVRLNMGTGLADTIERAIATALFNAWQDADQPQEQEPT